MRRAAFVTLTIGLMAITTAYAADYDAWFPAPLKNWTASKITYNEAKVDALSGKETTDSSKSDPMGLFTFTRYQVFREYYPPDKKGGVVIMFDNHDCLTAGTIHLLHTSAEARHKMGNSYKPVKVQSFDAVEGYNKKKQKEFVSVMFGGCEVALVSGRDVSDATISSYVRKLNLKKISKALK